MKKPARKKDPARGMVSVDFISNSYGVLQWFANCRDVSIPCYHKADAENKAERLRAAIRFAVARDRAERKPHAR